MSLRAEYPHARGSSNAAPGSRPRASAASAAPRPSRGWRPRRRRSRSAARRRPRAARNSRPARCRSCRCRSASTSGARCEPVDQRRRPALAFVRWPGDPASRSASPVPGWSTHERRDAAPRQRLRQPLNQYSSSLRLSSPLTYSTTTGLRPCARRDASAARAASCRLVGDLDPLDILAGEARAAPEAVQRLAIGRLAARDGHGPACARRSW